MNPKEEVGSWHLGWRSREIAHEHVVTHHINGRGGHSALVTMRLLVNGFTLKVRQMGGDFLLVDEPVSHPPTTATMFLRVDDSERSWPVRLPDGITAGCERVVIGPAN